jgi:hypothetical protein
MKLDLSKHNYVHNAYNVTEPIHAVNIAIQKNLNSLYKQVIEHTSEAAQIMPILNSRPL